MNEKILESAREKFAGILKSRREELNLTQQALADLCGCHINTINNLENGRFWPNLRQMVVIADMLRLDLILKNAQ